MKKNLFILLAIISIAITSCSKEEKQTKAIITLNNQNLTPAAGITVYAYTSTIWNLYGDDAFFANKTVVSNSNGNSEFILDEIINLFAFDNQETLYFSAHYSLNGVEKEKFIALTFEKFETQKGTIILD